MNEIKELSRRVGRVEKLTYILLAAILATHFIDPSVHVGLLQFP